MIDGHPTVFTLQVWAACTIMVALILLGYAWVAQRQRKDGLSLAYLGLSFVALLMPILAALLAKLIMSATLH